MNYRVIDKEKYYRKGVYEHFTKDCKCSTSMTEFVMIGFTQPSTSFMRIQKPVHLFTLPIMKIIDAGQRSIKSCNCGRILSGKSISAVRRGDRRI